MLVRSCAAGVAAGLVACGAAGAYDQTLIPSQPGDPTTNGCPAGFDLLALSDLAKYSYRLPFVLDAAGNQDGYVCGRPLEPQEQAARLPNVPVPIVFDFRDNDLKAAGH
jgi:hypothetical protein